MAKRSRSVDLYKGIPAEMHARVRSFLRDMKKQEGRLRAAVFGYGQRTPQWAYEQIKVIRRTAEVKVDEEKLAAMMCEAREENRARDTLRKTLDRALELHDLFNALAEGGVSYIDEHTLAKMGKHATIHMGKRLELALHDLRLIPSGFRSFTTSKSD